MEALALVYLVEARLALKDLMDKRDLNGDETFHDAMRAVTRAAEALGVPVAELDRLRLAT